MRTALRLTSAIGIASILYIIMIAAFSVFILSYYNNVWNAISIATFIWLVYFILLFIRRKTSGKNKRLPKVLLIFVILFLFIFLSVSFLGIWVSTPVKRQMLISEDHKITVIIDGEESLEEGAYVSVYKNFEVFRKEINYNFIDDVDFLYGPNCKIEWRDNGFNLIFHLNDGKEITKHYYYATSSFVDSIK